MSKHLRQLSALPLAALFAAVGFFAARQSVHSSSATNTMVRVGSLEPAFPSPVESHHGGTGPSTLMEVLQYVRGEFCESLPPDSDISNGAVAAMLRSLDDPDVRFLRPDAKISARAYQEGRFSGIGVRTAVATHIREGISVRGLQIATVAPGGPADLAGLLPGDEVESINGLRVIPYEGLPERNTFGKSRGSDSAYSLDLAERTLTSGEGLSLTLGVVRNGKRLTVDPTLLTETSDFSPAEVQAVAPNGAYVRCTVFGDRSDEIIMSGSELIRHASWIVLDLRNNGRSLVSGQKDGALGGYLSLLRLLGTENAGYLKRPGGSIQPIAQHVKKQGSHKFVVIVNGGVDGLAELAARILRSQCSAILVGEPTRGNAQFRKIVALDAGAAMTVSSAVLLETPQSQSGSSPVVPDSPIIAPRPTSGDSAARHAVSLARKL